ncbi:MAG: GntR family transcriptional regulator [Synergistes jonesii]|uniref:GntR family transcriptional regulator n=2 Tax=Synergistes jonesii TaxID=2754 RepID=UPI002A760EE7|nr:GntR family transcriptional regulator [Synergistes jonesii]MDY2984535.1 GntR family transcriptional regulator [Synergistes jonesii]
MENAEERAYRLIINEILSGVYHPGDFLLELDIAAQMEMSRTPVSRALSRLVAEGLLKKMPKKGCYIPIPTPKDAELVFTARQVAEGEAAALAAANVTEEDILTLESIVAQDKYIMDAGDKERWAKINEAFHLSIAKLCNNPYIEKWAKNMFWHSNVYIFYFDGFYKPSDIVIEHQTPAQHREIIAAIKERDVKKARSAMKRHIYTTYTKLLLPQGIEKI